jgi:hypothetical protein
VARHAAVGTSIPGGGMSCRSCRHVLALLADDEAEMWDVLERAIELAESERARLTIAKTTDPGWIVRWFAPLAALWRCGVMVVLDTAHNQRALDRASAHVPASIPLTRVLLGQDTARCVRAVAERSCCDLLIAPASLLARSRSLRREVRRLELCTWTVAPGSGDGTVTGAPAPRAGVGLRA